MGQVFLPSAFINKVGFPTSLVSLPENPWDRNNF